MLRVALAMVVSLVCAAAFRADAEPLDPADLSISAVSAPEFANPGDLVTFTVEMRNAGPAAALDATMLDPLPITASFVSMTFTPEGAPWECTAPASGATGKVACTKKEFDPRDSVVFTITIRVAACAGGGVLANVVTASSRNPDPNYADNTASTGPAVVDPGTCDDGDLCTVGDACAPSIAFSENFDAGSPRTLPPGWTATVVIGPFSAAWTTVNAASDTPPNSVFVLDAPEIRDSVLDSPSIAILTPTTQLHFMNRYDLEYAADGGVLEVQVEGRPFVDILDAGGQFESGGYDERIRSDQQSPIGGRLAWTGYSGGFRPTVVDLPSSFAGKNVVFRWRLTSDRSLGRVGQWVDTVTVTGPNACRPGTPFACDDANACTVDACDAATGCRHDTVGCDDGNLCTVDACDPSLGCIHTSNAAACDDGDVCTADVCDPAAGCVALTADFDAAGFSAGRVDGRDLAVLAAAWGSCPGGARYDAATNLDSSSACIDAGDFHAFMTAFGRRCGP